MVRKAGRALASVLHGGGINNSPSFYDFYVVIVIHLNDVFGLQVGHDFCRGEVFLSNMFCVIKFLLQLINFLHLPSNLLLRTLLFKVVLVLLFFGPTAL